MMSVAARMIREKRGEPGASRVDVRLWLRLLSCTTVIEKRLRRRFAEQFDTTLPRFDLLAALDRVRDGLTMGELSKTLLVSKGNVTGLVRELERQGLVSISSPPEDRRSSVVRLTAKGADLFSELAPAHHEWVGEMLAGVPREQQETLLELLALVKTSIGRADEDRHP